MFSMSKAEFVHSRHRSSQIFKVVPSSKMVQQTRTKSKKLSDSRDIVDVQSRICHLHTCSWLQSGMCLGESFCRARSCVLLRASQ